MHSRVFLTIDSFMVHDNPRPRNQSQKSKVDWCLETDHKSIITRDKPDAFFRAGKMHLPVAFYRRLSWALSVFAESRALCGHRNTRIFSQNQTSILAVSDKPTAQRHMPKYSLGGWINAFG